VETYGRSFYESRDENTRYAANAILNLLLDRIPAVQSAVDVGCGVGTWLSCLSARGITDVQGIEGPWARRDMLAIPVERFHQMELSTLTAWPRRFDLAISLEVAEHLDASRAEGFVRALCDMSDFVLFSAAVPFQGGKHHVNEQWPAYWAQLFEKAQYHCFDWLRQAIWNDPAIPVWYRQNILVFVAHHRLGELPQGSSGSTLPLAVIHPDMYLMKAAPRPLSKRVSNVIKRVRGLE